MKLGRRRVLLEGFQGRYVATQVMALIGCFSVFVVLLVGPLVWQVNHSAGSGLDVELERATALLELDRHLWMPLLALFLAVVLILVRLSHRIAGPLYRFRQVFGEIARGNLAVAWRIRERDYLHEEAAELVAMIGALRGQIAKAKVSIRSLGTELQRAADAPDRAWPQTIGVLAAQIAQTEAILDHFTTDPFPAPVPAPALALPLSTVGSEAGFSLVELLIVASIISVLAAIGAPAYTGALDRARITRAVGDISAIGKEVMMFQLSRGCFPGTLADIGREQLQDPWRRPYSYAVPRRSGGGNNGGSCQACGGDSCVAPGAARKNGKLVPINSDYDLYSAGKDGKSSSPLTAKNSQDDIIRARDGGFIGLASTY